MSTTEKYSAMAELFAEHGLPDTISPVWRDGSALIGLDFTVDSLKSVDDYLEDIRRKALPRPGLGSILRKKEPSWDMIFAVAGSTDAVSFVAAYIGEVIRRASSIDGVWMDFNEIQNFGGTAADIASDEGDIASWMNLVRGQSVSWPAAKVLKRIFDGPADDIHAYALVLTKNDD